MDYKDLYFDLIKTILAAVEASNELAAQQVKDWNEYKKSMTLEDLIDKQQEELMEFEPYEDHGHDANVEQSITDNQ